MAFQKLQIFVKKLIIGQTTPMVVEYLLLDNQRLKMLDLEHFVSGGVVGIDKDHLDMVELYQSTVRNYTTIASGEDLVRLRQFLVTETQRILQERLETYGHDALAKEMEL
ncbi:hypothetical protein HY496_02625 [Candidatus Woesearchaeota archaeon]|nr:hypothetical protein [Candidatus Woesearchaeota archaeon]